MENGHKAFNINGVGRSDQKVMYNGEKKGRSGEVILRMLVVLLTLVASIVVGVDKETTTVSITLMSSLPPLQIPVTAKWQYMSALVFLLVSNVFACTYAIVSLLYTLCTENIAKVVVVILDILVMGLLFSANGAAAAVGVIGRYGNSHVRWNKVCYMVDRFCRQLGAAFALSLSGSFVLLWLVVLAIFRLHKKSLA
ncbi:hypothetical protein K2173_004717 [Erythroxylum novogranatense]|uniref:CASP-like protein n=1 Tax=Erythroxylum novogranatense TaxID=1862640 RepID=A0AAV8U8D3_9ROSI|nr:hypothetical protein K2173_004717 [Erythroxylum novogranatense]